MEVIVLISFVVGSFGFAFGVDAKLRLKAIEAKLAELAKEE